MKNRKRMDLETICRTCSTVNTKQDEFAWFFPSAKEKKLLPKEVLFEVNSFNLVIAANDGLPQQMCSKCQDAFSSISQFRKQCLDVQGQLAEHYGWVKKDSESDDEKSSDYNIMEVIVDSEENKSDPEDELGNNDNIIESNAPSDQVTEGLIVKTEVSSEEPDNDVLISVESIMEDSDSTESPKKISGSKLPIDSTSSSNDPSFITEAEYEPCELCNSDSPNSPVPAEPSPRCPKYCPSCKIHFNSELGFEQHMNEPSSKCRLLTCSICHRAFSSASNRKTHMQLHNAQNFKCEICGQGFKSKIYVSKHKKAVHETGHHVCSTCGRKFTNTMKYNYHMRSHNPDKKFKCSYCERSFMQQHHLSNHERIHTGLRPFLCTICGKNFKQESNLRLHLRLHSGERPYVCSVCGKDFRQRGSFVMHMRNHNNIKPYQCEVCGKSFIQLSSLTVHLRVHTGEKPYKCDVCEKSFTQTHQLKYHKYSFHNGPPYSENKSKGIRNDSKSVEKQLQEPDRLDDSETSAPVNNSSPYACPICSRGFKLPSSLTSHIKCHSEERKHVCTECGNTFKRAEHLRIHINGVHLKRKPYACDFCDKSFSQSGDRNIHMRCHTHEKPYQCQYCKKAFKLQKSLRAHERIHTGERPFCCEICVKDFISYNALAIHTMKHSDEEKKLIKDRTLLDIKNTIVSAEITELT